MVPGFSLGEYAALVAASALDIRTALVQWIKAVQNMLSARIDAFYEISPKPTLAAFIKNIAKMMSELLMYRPPLGSAKFPNFALSPNCVFVLTRLYVKCNNERKR
jgi:acyl transferase domain-containing protein